jgi:transporter family protein
MKADIYLLVATILWGVWGFADKMAVARAHPFTAQFLFYLPSLFFVPLWYLMSRKVGSGAAIDLQAAGWAFLASISSMLAMYLLFLALQSKPASIAMAMTSAYPLVTLTLAMVMRMEHLTLEKIAGMGLIIAGVILLGD